MQIVFGGKFESALIRSIDEVLQPDRNTSTHGYYVGLNRWVPRAYFERCSTFIVIAEGILVPSIDWNYPYSQNNRGVLSDIDFGIESTKGGGGEWDDETGKFVKLLLLRQVLSPSSMSHISTLETTHYSNERKLEIDKNISRYSADAANHYLNRLFLQMRASRETKSFLVLGEQDIQIIQEIANFVLAASLPTPFDIPNLSGKIINPDAFCNGLLNFSPPDIRSVGAVRANDEIRRYSSKIRSLLGASASGDREQKFFEAILDAHDKTKIGRRTEKVFEVASWVVKPLHYVPIIGEVIGAAEDVKDLALKWSKRKLADEGWYLIAPRMADIAIREYIERNRQRFGSA